MAEVDTSSYPRPQPPVNPLDQITKVGQVVDTLGNIEAGKAVQGAIQDDGSIDRNALSGALKSTVAGSMKAIPTLNAYEQLRNAGHVADQAGLDNFQKRMAVVNHLFGQLAAKDNPTIQDVNSIAARVLDPALQAGKFGLTFPVVMNALKNFRGPDGKPLSPQEIKKRAADMQLMTASTSEQLESLAPRYTVEDDGNTLRTVPRGNKMDPRYPNIVKRPATGTETVDNDPHSPTYRQRVMIPAQPVAPEDQEVDTYGRPIKTPPYASDSQKRNALSGVVSGGQEAPNFAERFAPAMAGAPAKSLRPGVSEAAVSTAQNSAQLGNQLVTASAEVPAVKGILDNMDRELDNFTSGGGADWKRFAKSFAAANLPESWQKEGGVLDPRGVASQEGFNKLAYQLAQRQFQQLGGTGTDSKLSSAMATSPNETITKLGNKGIMQMRKGNNDALAVQAKEWNAWKKTHGEDSFSDFVDDFNQHFDPRVFQFQYVPKKERQTWYKNLSPEERRRFEEDADYALAKKWIKP